MRSNGVKTCVVNDDITCSEKHVVYTRVYMTLYYTDLQK